MVSGIEYKPKTDSAQIQVTSDQQPTFVIDEDKMFDFPHAKGELMVGYKQPEYQIKTMPADSLWKRFGMHLKQDLGETVSSAKSGAISTAVSDGPIKILLLQADDPNADLQEKRRQLLSLPGVQYVEPNYIIRLNKIPNDTNFDQLYGMNKIHAPYAWDITTGSNTVVVGVIDSGIDYTHPDLAANIWTNPGEIPDNGTDDDNNGYVDDVHGYDFFNLDGDPMDDNFHGTHVAGTIGAVGGNNRGVAGVAWDVKLVALKVFNEIGEGQVFNAVSAMKYADKMGIPITNHSWGWAGSSSQILANEITKAQNKGFLFIAAAGNGGPDYIGDSNDATPHYPASYSNSNIISVANTDDTDNLTESSNYGYSSVDISAPGHLIHSAFPSFVTQGMWLKGYSTVDYDTISGTSMATPHVTGAAALIKGYNPHLTGDQIKNAILGSVDKINSLDTKVRTGGRLNVHKALLAVPPDWISIETQTGEITAGRESDIKITANPLNLSAGTYTAIIKLETNDPARQVIQLNITANVDSSFPPQISDIADIQISEDKTTEQISYSISDTETSAEQLIVTADSDATELVPVNNIVLSGIGTNRFFQITPLANQYGNCTITLTVSDTDSKTASTSFQLSVMPQDDPPVLTGHISDINVTEDAGPTEIDLSNLFTDIDNDPITKTVHNSNLNLVSAEISENLLTLTYKNNQSGTANITIRGTSNGKFVDDVFTVNVQPAEESADGDIGADAGGCFIATAAYGSYYHPKVEVLKTFRDNYFLTNSWGRAFVEFYYENAPAAADRIALHDFTRAVVRGVLLPVVFGIKYPAWIFLILIFAAGFKNNSRLKKS